MGQCTPHIPHKQSRRGKTGANTTPAQPNLSYSTHNCIKPKPILEKVSRQNKGNSKHLEKKRLFKNILNDKIKIKVPKDENELQFRWIEENVIKYPREIYQVKKQIIRNALFQQKLAWFRENLNKIRGEWTRRAVTINIDRENIIKSSLQALSKVNLYQQIKVQFKGDDAEDSGGGLFRQWMHLCIKQIMSPEKKIFKLCNSSETAYQFVWNNWVSDQESCQAISLLGLIIGKAIIEKVSLNCCFNRSISRQICRQPVHLSDVYSFDKTIYSSLASILNLSDKEVELLCLNGTISHRFQNETSEEVEIFENGKSTPITSKNLSFYLQELIHLYCTRSVEGELDLLLKALYSIIPSQLFSIFEPHQFDMLISGPAQIDIQDWQKNTVYDGYENNSEVIIWFWQAVKSYGQEGHRNLLHYCTGSTRVPILGFSHLESSHSHIKKFTIRKVEYNEQNPYPKSFTCFNRLELPEYTSKEELIQRLSFALDDEFSYFGLC